MLGNMMQGQLLISGLIEHAEAYHADAEIVSRTVEGPIHRYTFSDAAKRALSKAEPIPCLCFSCLTCTLTSATPT